MLESLGSARIEGNHTTLADYVESRLESGPASSHDALRELANIEAAMDFIEAHVKPGGPLTEHFVRELHAITLRDLELEGDATPGAYRQHRVQIAQSEHLPPEAVSVSQYMSELTQFINHSDPSKYDLIKVALTHHRFAWIHPFGKGNGRVVRLLTYALLIKYGFNVQTGGRVLNPTAIFCNDRDHYYTMLARADIGTDTDREAWCVYVLRGMLDELRKLDQLANADYLFDRILRPAFRHAHERGLITPLEERVMLKVAQKGTAKAIDLVPAMQGMTDRQRTYQIGKLIERNMLLPIRDGARQYTIGFANNVLLRGVIRALSEAGFIPDSLNQTQQAHR